MRYAAAWPTSKSKQFKMRRTALVCALTIVFMNASADEANERSARELLKACETNDAYCDGFLAGTLSAHRFRDSYSMVVSGQQLLCIPDDLTLAAYRAQFVAYSTPREKELDWDSSVLALAALEHHHACLQ